VKHAGFNPRMSDLDRAELYIREVLHSYNV